MDLSCFKILKEDQDNYHVGHPNGKTLVVSKGGLSEKAKKALHMYADGGEVAPDSGAPAQATADVQAPEVDRGPASAEPAQIPTAEDVQAPSPQPLSGELSKVIANPAAAQPGNYQSMTTAANAINAVKNAVNQQDPLVKDKIGQEALLNKEEGQIRNYTAQEEKLNNDAAGFYKDYNDKADKMKSPQDIVADYKTKDDALMKSYMDQKIDPERFYKNMSTGSKVAAAVGLAFSGFGAGLTGQSNLAMDHLNKAVNEDIEAQKNEQGKNLNLYKMNQEALGNDLHAQAATQNQLWTGVQAKIAMVTAQSKNPEMHFKGQQMIDQIEQQKMQNRLKLGLLSEGTGQGGKSTADPVHLVNELVPEAQRLGATNDIGKIKALAKDQNNMLANFDKAAKENTVLRTGAGLRTPTSIYALQSSGQPFILDSAGRPNEIQQKIYNNLLPQPGDTDAKIAEKRVAFTNFLNAQKVEATNRLAAYGIKPENFMSTSTETLQALPKDEQFRQWALANPDDPRAQKYMASRGQ